MPKTVHFGEFFKTWNLRSSSGTRQVIFSQKFVNNAKLEKFKCDIRYFQTLLDFLDKIVDLRTVCYWKLTYLKKSLEQGTKFLHVQVGNIHLFSSLSNPNTSGRSLKSVCQSSKFATRLTPHWILKKERKISRFSVPSAISY